MQMIKGHIGLSVTLIQKHYPANICVQQAIAAMLLTILKVPASNLGLGIKVSMNVIPL
jgi:hypothetical protein